MDCENSPYSVNMPKGWEKFTAYTNGGERPSYEEAQALLDEYLEIILIENCLERPRVSASVRREPGCSVRATDFDEGGCLGFCRTDVVSGYRRGSGMKLLEPESLPEKRFGFDCRWDVFKLSLSPGEYAEYTFFAAKEGSSVAVEFSKGSDGQVEVFQDGRSLGTVSPGDGPLQLLPAAETVIRVAGGFGESLLERIIFE